MKAATTEYTVTSHELTFRKYGSRVGLVVFVCLAAYLGNAIHTQQTMIDAAQAKADKEALRTELIVETSPEATIMCDQNGVVVQSNYATELMLGWSRSELKGQPATVLMPEAAKNPHRVGMDRSLEQIRGYEGNSMILSRDRKLLAINRDGNPVTVLVSIRVIKFMDEVQFIAVMRPDKPEPVIPPHQPVPLPELPASNVAIERAISTLSDESLQRQESAVSAVK